MEPSITSETAASVMQPAAPAVDTVRSSLALRLALLAAVLGLIGDLLLRDAVWGLNFAIFALLAALATLWASGKARQPIDPQALLFLAPVVVFAGLFVWHDSPELKLANFTAVMFAVGALAVRAHKGKVQVGSVVDYSFSAVGHWLATPFTACLLVFDEVKWTHHVSAVQSKKGAAILRGLLFATPLVLVFGALFASADKGFQDLVTPSISLDADDVVSHAAMAGVIAMVVGGLLKNIFLPWSPANDPVQGPPIEPVRIGITELAIVLGSLIAVFGLFVAVQFTHFFGGHNLVQDTQGLTYAEYARSGFFELVAVAAITLPMLLLLHAGLDKRDPKHEQAFLWLARFLVALVFVVIWSAGHRMLVYVESYGLSVLRVYTSAFMVWLSLTFVWLAVTQLRRGANRFAFGALAAGFLTILALNLMNPDATIARVNTTMGGRALDAAYLGSLSADAVPVLVEALPSMPTDKREVLEATLRERWAEPLADLREFNFGRSAAARALD